MRHRVRKRYWVLILLLLLGVITWRSGWGELLVRSGAARLLDGVTYLRGDTLLERLADLPARRQEARAERERLRRIEADRLLRQWPREKQSGCAEFDRPGPHPAICIRRLGSKRYGKGEPVFADILWKNLPASAGLMVHLQHDTEAAAWLDYLGPQGPMEMHARPLGRSGAMRFTWPGKGFPCAPSDVPIICNVPIEVGRYRLLAKIYPTAHVMGAYGLIGPEGFRDLETAAMMHSTSPSFEVTGAPDLQHIKRTIYVAAVERHMGAGAGLLTSSTYLIGDFGGERLDLRSRLGRYCARIGAKPPYRSTLDGCVLKRDVRDRIGLRREIGEPLVAFTGELALMDGAMPERRAVEIASAAARPRHARLMRGLRLGEYGKSSLPYISYNRADAAYRPDLGGLWYIELTALLAGGSEEVRRHYPALAERLLVRVEPSGAACVIALRPYSSEPFPYDLEADTIPCPSAGKVSEASPAPARS